MVTWGDSSFGGNSSTVSSALASGVTSVFSTERAFAALKGDGSVVTWGDSSHGGNSSTVSTALASGVTSVFSTYQAFAALKGDGSVVTWGSSNTGGASSTVSTALASGVTSVFSTDRAFAALKRNGSVVTWGDSSYGGQSSTVSFLLSEFVTQVYSTSRAFIAVRYGVTDSPTQSPLTSAPTSLSPTTRAPTTSGPTTETPTSISPTTGTPTSSSPATDAPTQSPVTRSPTLEGPTAVSAIFSDPVTSIRIQFSRVVDPLVPSNCEAIFSASTVAALGTSPYCVWAGSSTLDITLGIGFSLSLRSPLAIAGDVIFASGEIRRTPSHSVVVAPPLNPLVVAISVAAPTAIGVCDLFVESAATAVGGAGKPFNYTWKFHKSFPASTMEFENRIVTYLRNPSLGSRVVFSGANFSLNTRYWFNVTATNWLGTAATTSFSFSKLGKALPSLALPSATTIAVRRAEPLEIRVQVSAPKCVGFDVPTLVTRGLWSQTQGPSVSIPDPSSVYLYVPANSLDAGTQYKFQIYVWTTDSADQLVGNVTETFTVTAQQEAVIAVISGGASRSVSVGSSQWLSFDASESHDPMYPDTTVNYTWTVTPGPVALNNSLTSTVNGSRLSFSPALLSANQSYTISVTVRGARGRSATANQEVVTSAAPIPEVSISASYARGKHNPGDRLILSALVTTTNVSIASLRWTCSSQNFNVSDRSRLRSGLEGYYLVFAAHALNAGLSYEFRFAASTISGSVGYATARVIVNAPPTLGSCLATPQVGTALETRFRLGCSGWTDDDVPLLYKFQVASTHLDVCDFRQLEYYDTLLPAGSSQFRAIIMDDYGGISHSLFNVSVSQPAQLDLDSAERERNERLAEGDTQAFAVLCAGTAAYLKSAASVNASTATSSRNDLLDSIQALQNASTASVGSLVASLVEAVTDYDDPSEMADENNQDQAIALLQSVSSTSDVLTDDTIVASTTAVTNLVSATAKSNTTSRLNSSTSIESVLIQLSAKMLESAVPGEDQQTAQTRDGSERSVSIEINGRVASASLMGSTVLSSTATGTTVEFPPLPTNVESTSSVQLSAIAVQGNALYPVNLSTGIPGRSLLQGGLVSIHVRNSSGESLSVYTNETHPFKFTVPLGLPQAPDNTDQVGFRCEYWNVAAQSWQQDGVRAFNISRDGAVHCNSTHLTAFSSNTEFQIRVNTFSGRDITLEAFDPRSNPMMALLVSMFAVFAVLYPCVWFHDCRMRRLDRDGSEELNFWRTMNRMYQEHAEGSRAAHRYKTVMGWAIRRRHPWISLFFRPPGDYLNSRKRLLILLVLLLNMACVCTLLMGNDQSLPFIQGPVANALVACAFAFPIPFVFARLFGRKTPSRFRIRRDQLALSGGCVGYMMMIMGICMGVDSVDEEGEDHDGGDMDDGAEEDDEAMVDEKERDNDEEEDEKDEKRARQSRPGDRDDEKRERFRSDSDRKIDIGGAAGGGAAGGATVGAVVGNRVGSARRQSQGKRASIRKELLRDVRRERKRSIAAGIELSDLKRGRRSMQESKRQSGVQSTRRASEQTRRYSSHYSRKTSSTANGAGAPLGLRRDGITTHEWTKRDISGAGFLFVVACGCVFVLGMLSWTHHESVTEAVQTTMTSFAQDILARAFLIALTEYILVAPLCLFCCVCFYSFTPGGDESGAGHRTSHYRTVRVHSDRKAFEFDSAAKVTTIHRQARVRGVKVGMRIAAVDGNSVWSGQEARQRLVRAHRMRDSFTVTFVDDRARRSAASASARATSERKTSLLRSSAETKLGSSIRMSRPSTDRASASLSLDDLDSSATRAALMPHQSPSTIRSPRKQSTVV